MVTFDGVNSVVLVDPGVLALDAEVDLYSDWKEFAATGTNLRYLPAFRTVGGDPISATSALGATFFITNNWVIRPSSFASHELLISGNLYAEEGADIFVASTGTVTVLGLVERAIDTLTEIVNVSGSSSLNITQELQLTELHQIHGLETGTPLTVSEIQRDAGAITQAIADDTPVVGSRRMTRS